jgi:hypothetical protein
MHAEHALEIRGTPSVALVFELGRGLEALDGGSRDAAVLVEQTFDGVEAVPQHPDLGGQFKQKSHHLVDRRIVEKMRPLALGVAG